MSPQILVGGQPLHYETLQGPLDDPKRPVLVFLHEALGSVSQWKDFPALLCAKTGLPGLVYDRFGHGGSAPLQGTRTREYLHVEAFDVLHKLLEGLGAHG